MTTIIIDTLSKGLRAEFQKAKRKPALLLVLAVVGINTVYLFAGLSRAQAQSLSQPWESVMFYLALMNTLMLSAFMAILASRCMDLEHKGCMWNTLHTVQSKSGIFFAKSLYGLFWIIVFEIVQWTAVIAAGKIYGFAGMPPLRYALRAALSELLGGMTVFQIQCVLSLIFPSQFAALSIGLCGTFAGFFLMYVSDRIIIPWSVIPALRVLNMSYNEGDAAASYEWYSAPAVFWFIAVIYLAAAVIAGLALYDRMEEGALTGTDRAVSATASAHTFLPAELIKLRRAPVWIAFLAVPLISALIGTFNFTANQGVLSFTWDALWTQHSLFLGIFFLPGLIGVFCSLLWRMEHNGTNWNLVLSVESPEKLVRDKMLTASGMSVLCVLWTGFLYIVCGFAVGLTDRIPGAFFEGILCGMLACAAISAMQSWLSLVIRSFALPIGIAFAGGFAGTFCLVKGWNYLLPYSLLQLGMRSTSLDREVSMTRFVLAAAFFIGLFYALSVIWIKRKDARTRE